MTKPAPPDWRVGFRLQDHPDFDCELTPVVDIELDSNGNMLLPFMRGQPISELPMMEPTR